MSRRGIVAEWISPDRLYAFTACNLMMNLGVWFFFTQIFALEGKRMGNVLFELSDQAGALFLNTFRIYGVFILVLGIFLFTIGHIGKKGGIDLRRNVHLIILGVINMIHAASFLGR